MKKIRTWQLCRAGTFGQDGARITKKDLAEIEETFAPTRPISIVREAARGEMNKKCLREVSLLLIAGLIQILVAAVIKLMAG